MEENEIPKTVTQGDPIASGKTKIIHKVLESIYFVIILSKSSLTKGDGIERLELEGKDEWATITTCRIFELLNFMGIPTHFIRQLSATSFLAYLLDMFPFEIVIRRIADGSYLQRNPWIIRGTILDYVIEVFWKNDELRDPMVIWNDKKQWYYLYDAHKPISDESCLGELPRDIKFMPTKEEFEAMFKLQRNIFIILEAAWAMVSGIPKDLKLEYGIDKFGRLRLGDVVDNDSWRIELGGIEMSKQAYRDATEITDDVKISLKGKFKLVAKLTEKFNTFREELKRMIADKLK